MKHLHDIPSAFKQEFANPRLWWTRAVVIGMAAIAGLVVVGFTWLAEGALDVFLHFNAKAWWLVLLWTPALTALIVWLTRRYAVGAAGSSVAITCGMPRWTRPSTRPTAPCSCR
ncbi:MAG: hypothetical protein RLZZ237_18 [Pseudomonadota bacterium]